MSEKPDTRIGADKLQQLITRGPFNQWLNFTIVKSDADGLELKAAWREEWVVNPDRRYTHGGILAAIVVPRVMEHPGEARQVRAKQDIQAVVTALNTYKLDNFTYPSTEQGLDALVRKPAGTPEAPNWHQYLDKLPKDPWGRTYLYLHPGSHGDIDVFSYGADGKPGGDGENADVGNWDN